MPQPLRGPQSLYATVMLAALVTVIFVARRQQVQPAASSRRAAPEFATADSHRPRAPRPLVISESVSPVPQAAVPYREVPAGFPTDESDDVGPITGDETSIYAPVAESAAEKDTLTRRLAPVEAGGFGTSTPAAAGPVASPAPPSTPRGPQVVNDDGMRPVLQQAAQLNRQAESLARRGAYYLARNLTIQSLRMIAEALDLQTGTGEHTAALSSALAALREAADFQSRSSEDSTVNVPLVVAGHRTPVLRQQNAEGLSAIAAQQQYFNYARQQLVVAAGGQSVASHSLCNLGKLQSRMSEGTAPRQTNLARSMVYQQAALAVDRRNYPAANELGVLLTSIGQDQEARGVLVQCIGISANPDSWHHLAIVHDRLGEVELAAHARSQRDMLTGRAGGPRPKIQWVSPEVFAGNQPTGSGQSAAASPSMKSDERSADSRPKQKETWLTPFGIKR
ncbi:MAG: hypothetical protein IAF94_10425 [Pirellulaceae bacterium]|nr:hypothetical protein [Pirellulaceae bacterium]